MNDFDYKTIIENYLTWIRNNTEIRNISNNKFAEITTPFLDRHNDHIVIYGKKNDTNVILTDDGYTVSDLKMTGLELASPKRKHLFEVTLRGFGVKFNDKTEELYVEGRAEIIGQKKHALLQAILAINDMYTLTVESIQSFFKEDVERFFSSNKIFFSKDLKLAGKSGFDHNIDFIISASPTYPERLVKVLNSPKKDLAMSIIFAFEDIRTLREDNAKRIVFYNDHDKKASSDVVSAFKNYGVQGIPWSERAKHIEELTMA